MYEKTPDAPTPTPPSASTTPRTPEETVVGCSSADTLFLRAVLPVLGAAAGVGLRWLAAWMSGLSWAPWQGIARSVDTLADRWGACTVVGLAIVGAIVGAVFAQHLVETMGRVAVTSTGAGFKTKDTLETLGRSEVTDVFADGKEIVLLRGEREVARWSADLPSAEVRAAFDTHGWPWRETGDPFRAAYRPWAAGDLGLPAGADALLRARAGLIDAGKDDHVRELRADLAAIGVVVRDEGTVQLWRPVAPAAPTGAIGVERRA
ncbi:hypothetical protein ACFWFR_02600 [Oerskovia sp. NPDC060287]|uniref:YqeB family protein n=1 Tax=Oerskovia sp. NPDC060287 TaxID=3347095 RepID=UPI003648012C